MKLRLAGSVISKVVACIAATLTQGWPAIGQAAPSCQSYPPVPVVMGAKIYKENGVPDAAGATSNRDLLAPINDFLTYEAKALDRPGSRANLDCPYKVLEDWATSNALLEPPETPGRVARVWIASGIGFIVLKFKLRGVEITPAVKRWLSELAAAVRSDYREPLKKGSYAGFYSNVYPWSAVTNAIAALVSDDAEAMQFQDEAWTNMIAEIRSDGVLPGEMGRGQRALIYHQLAANGLLTLHKLRRALGREDDPAQTASLKRLLEFVGDTLCHPDAIQAAASAKQETPGVWGFRMPLAFGGDLLPQTWKACGPKNMSWFTAEYGGGDTRVSAQAVAAATRH